MIHHSTVDITSQRIRETQQAIVEQRTYVGRLTDPALKAIAARTLATLEDMLLIMQRTHSLLIVTRTTDVSVRSRPAETGVRPHPEDPAAPL
jgi:hypothetical protein